MEWLPRILDALKLPIRYLWTIAIATGVVLILPDFWAAKLHIADMRSQFGTGIGVAFIASASIGLVDTIVRVSEFFKRNRQKALAGIERLSYLSKLDAHEKAVIRDFFLHGKNTIKLPIDHPSVVNLLSHRILKQACRYGERSLAGMLFPVTLSKDVADLISDEMIAWPNDPESPEGREFLIENRPEFTPEIEHHDEVFHTSWNRGRIW